MHQYKKTSFYHQNNKSFINIRMHLIEYTPKMIKIAYKMYLMDSTIPIKEIQTHIIKYMSE